MSHRNLGGEVVLIFYVKIKMMFIAQSYFSFSKLLDLFVKKSEEGNLIINYNLCIN